MAWSLESLFTGPRPAIVISRLSSVNSDAFGLVCLADGGAIVFHNLQFTLRLPISSIVRLFAVEIRGAGIRSSRVIHSSIPSSAVFEVKVFFDWFESLHEVRTLAECQSARLIRIICD